MKSEVNKVLFIVNKYAGTGYQPEVEGKIIGICQQRAIECAMRFTEGPGHASALASEAVAAGDFDHVVAVGGDGTVNEVAQGLVHSAVVMGIIPKGSGNGLARHLRIPMAIPDAVRSMFSSRVIAMDTFRMNGKLSLNVSGIGFDGHIANLFATGKKRGLATYMRHVLKEFGSFREFTAEIQTADGITAHKAFVVAVANSSQYGNNARIAPAASVCDRLLHINILRKVPLYRWDVFYSIFAGNIDRSDYCQIVETDHLNVRLTDPMPFHVDGEPCGKSDHFEVSILPASLKMLVPAESTEL